MGVQTSVAFNPVVAIEGQVSRDIDVRAFPVTAALGINNGRLVVQGASDLIGKLPTTAAEVLKAFGVSPYRATQMPNWPPGGTSTHYQAGDTIECIRTGRVWVLTEEAVNAQDPVFVRYAAGAGGTNLGAFRKSADTATAAQLTGAVYLTSTAGAGLALVEVNLPA